MKIGLRLGLSCAGVLVLVIVMAAIGATRLSELGGKTEYIVKDALKKERMIEEWLNATTANGVRTFALAKSQDPATRKFLQTQIRATTQHISENQKSLDATEKTAAEKALFSAVGEKRAAYIGARDTVFKVKEAGNEAEAALLAHNQHLPALNAYVDSIHVVLKNQKSLIDNTAVVIDADYRSGRALLIGLALVAVVFGSLFVWRLTVGIVKPLQSAVKIAGAVAGGDLTQQIEAASRDETGQLMQALRNMNDSLINIVGQVRSGTDTISTASSQIASGNQDLSSRTEQQASSLEETASSMDELTGTVRHNADNARQAIQLAVSASEVAENGGAVVSQVVDTLDSIKDSSKKIVDIIGVIAGIAFQTNILALNAAVEAARAGEQGRGFAEVAGEVRNLAQRSASAAKEIKGLIGDSVEKVEAGSKLVNQAGATMDEIVGSVRRVTDVMVEIMAASQEQSTGIEQVNQAIAQMDQVTQQNAALVEEAAAAAESMQDQAAALARLVATFKLQLMAGIDKPLQKAAARPEHRPQPALSRKPLAALPAARVTRKASAAGNEDWEEF